MAKEVLKTFKKDPAAVLDYGFDLKALTHALPGALRDWLASGETVTAHALTAEDGLVVDSSSESDGLITAWLSGGTAGARYLVTCQFTTSAGRTDRRRIQVEVVERGS